MDASTERPRHRFSVDDYHRMIDSGLFAQQRLELINGEIIDMSPQSPTHFGLLLRIAKTLEELFGVGFHARPQGPLALQHSEPEPDVAVVRGHLNDYLDRHPTTAELVVEVSDTSLAYDRRTKSPVYAEAGIPEYWVVNLSSRVLEVYREPKPIGSGFGYGETRHYRPDERVSPLGAPAASVLVSDLLP